MKKVLLAAYHYPPTVAVGGIRPSKFVRYLPTLGWNPIVLTTLTDELSASIIGSETAEVHRVREWPHPLKAYERFKRNLAKRQGLEEELVAKMTVSHAVAIAPPRTRGIMGLKRWLMAFFWLPDQEVGWLVPAIWRGVRTIRKRQIGLLITTGPPHTCHLVGLALKRITGVRWIADFRDPWSLNDKFPIFRNRVTDSIESRLIRSVMRVADIVLSVTPQMTERARKEHTELDPSKFVTLTSGFDPDDFIGLSTARPSVGALIFSYLGSFYHGRTPQPFLRALSGLIADRALKRSDIFVKFVGQVTQSDGQSVRQMVRELGLDENVSIASAVPRPEALRLTVESDVVLVLDEQHPAQIPFKLYDAMAAGAVIFNIGSRGAVSEVLAKTGRGISVDHANIAEIRAGILECIRRSRSNRRDPEPWADPRMHDYNFQRLTARLAGLLEGLAQPEDKLCK